MQTFHAKNSNRCTNILRPIISRNVPDYDENNKKQRKHLKIWKGFADFVNTLVRFGSKTTLANIIQLLIVSTHFQLLPHLSVGKIVLLRPVSFWKTPKYAKLKWRLKYCSTSRIVDNKRQNFLDKVLFFSLK